MILVDSLADGMTSLYWHLVQCIFLFLYWSFMSYCLWWTRLCNLLACILYFGIINDWIIFIHAYLISLIGSLVNTRSVLKMSNALSVLGPNWAWYVWCVIAHELDPSPPPPGKIVDDIFMFSDILKPFYLLFF